MRNKRIVRGLVFVSLLVMFFAAAGWCKENYFVRVGEKFGRGIYNVFYSPLEIPKAMEQGFINDEFYKMLSIDPMTGLMHAFARAGVGLYEVVSSPYPQKPILYPVYIMPNIREYLFYMKDDNGP